MRDDDRIEKLGKYFIHFNIQARFGISFHQFIIMVERGDWKELVA